MCYSGNMRKLADISSKILSHRQLAVRKVQGQGWEVKKRTAIIRTFSSDTWNAHLLEYYFIQLHSSFLLWENLMKPQLPSFHQVRHPLVWSSFCGLVHNQEVIISLILISATFSILKTKQLYLQNYIKFNSTASHCLNRSASDSGYSITSSGSQHKWTSSS